MLCRRYLLSCRMPSPWHPSWSCICHRWRWPLSTICASWPTEIKFLFSFSTCLTFFNFNIKPFKRLTITSPFSIMSQGSSFLRYTLHVHLSHNFERCRVGKWRERRRPSQSPMIHWNQSRRESKHMIHHSSWHMSNLSLCFYLLHPSACSPSKYTHFHHTANIWHPFTWNCLSLIWIWIWICHSFLISIHRSSSLINTQGIPWCFRQPQRFPAHLFFEKNTYASSKFKVLVSQELLSAIMRSSRAYGRLDNRTNALISS